MRKKGLMKYIYFPSVILTAMLLLSMSNCAIGQGEELMPYLKGELYGFANSKGEIIIEPAYDFVMPFENGFSSVRLNYKWGIIREDGKVLLEPIAKNVSPFDDAGLSLVNIDGKYGVINTKGKWIVPMNHSWIERKLGFIQVKNDLGKAALLNSAGEVLVDFKYDYFLLHRTSSLDSNFIIVEENNQFGLIEIKDNKRGIVKISPQYESLRALTEKFLVAEQNDRLGLVNMSGEIIVPFEYDEFKTDQEFIIAEQEIPYKAELKIIETDEYYYSRRRDEIETEYDEKNKIVYYLVTQEEYDRLKSYGQEIAPDFRRMMSVFNLKGKCIIPPQSRDIEIDTHFIQARTVLSEIDAETLLYFKDGRKVLPTILNSVDEVHDGLILVKFRSDQEELTNAHERSYEERTLHFYNRFKYGFIDSTGEWVLSPEYNGAYAFNQGRAPVRKAFKWALINKMGEELTEYKYDQLYFAGENRFAFRQDKRWGLMDLNGKEIIPATYYEYGKSEYEKDYFGGYSGLTFNNGKALTSKHLPSFPRQSVTMIDTNGIQLFPFKYLSIEEPVDGLFIVGVKNHDHDRPSYGLIDRSGKVLVPAEQDHISWIESEQLFVVSPKAYQQKYMYYDQNGQKTESLFKAIKQEGLRDYKRLPNGYFTAKWRQFTVYFTPEGIPLFEE